MKVGWGFLARHFFFVGSTLGFSRGSGAGDKENASRMEQVNLGCRSGGVDK